MSDKETTTPVIMETERLTFRPWLESDAEVLFKYASDPDVGPRAGWSPHKSVEESLQIIREVFASEHMWALVLKETNEPIGCIGYFTSAESNIGIGADDAEAGYWIAKPYWNRGLCTEALQEMMRYCRRKGFAKLWADCFVDNPPSAKVMQKCGFIDTGCVNNLSQLYYMGDGRPVSVMVCEL